MVGWSNWSGGVRAAGRVAVPADEAELAALLRESRGQTVRVTGSGHSFTPLCASDDVIVSIERLAGVRAVDPDAGTAEVRAGTRLHALGEPLRFAGLALHNQGDVDVQTLGGATGTATHGTGPTLGNLSTAVTGVRVLTASGETVDADADHEPDVWQGARVSLGALGIVTRIRLALAPAYDLHERTWQEPADACLARLSERIAATRHYEFFWWPTLDTCESKTLHPPAPDLDPRALPEGERVDRSYRIFPTVRDLKFEEMEYTVPADEGPACFAAIRALYRDRHPDVGWPVEYRTVAADDLWLSPHRDRASVTISVHQDHRLDHDALFADCEAVFREHRGRPHWGKHHSRGGADLAVHYPDWDRFWGVADRLDPEGRFLSPYLRRLRDG